LKKSLTKIEIDEFIEKSSKKKQIIEDNIISHFNKSDVSNIDIIDNKTPTA
jgi:hypothetical protein